MSKYVSLAGTGKEIVICVRNRPVAKLVAFSPNDVSEEDLLLVSAGLMRLPQEPLNISEFLMIPTGTVPGNEGIQALLDDREEE